MMIVPIIALGVMGSGVVARSIKLKKIQRRMNERIAALSSQAGLLPELD